MDDALEAAGDPLLRLQLLGRRHHDLYHGLHSAPEVMSAIAPPLAATAIDAQFARVVRHNGAARPGHRCWAIDSPDHPGGLGVVALLRDGDRAELGIMLRPQAWGRGIATRTIRRLLPHAFGAMGLRQVDASRARDPHAALIDRLLLPLGFRRMDDGQGHAAHWQLDTATPPQVERADALSGAARTAHRSPNGPPPAVFMA